ncbi:hypothetical protein OPT61_g89 [Boeremia exigua]|uniref:Uncharacterized protein n=1 Tax=Boeremia exigua TaxID=749465 RepID=A0ACC2IV75_9PLEO|nr:hypothetical protein OPT61_g89 [Boeremia exigua]
MVKGLAGQRMHAFLPGFTSTPIFGKFQVTWQKWFSDPLFAALKLTQKWVAVVTDEGAKTGIWLATWEDEIGVRDRGGLSWESMLQRTSVADLINGRRSSSEWRNWERDAQVVWSVRFPMVMRPRPTLACRR